MSDKFDVYQAVTDEIVKALESGTVPWRKPWRTVGGDVPRNLISGREELIAELGAAMLATLAGIDTSETIPPSASYIASWLKALADDPKMVVQAAGKAQRAADFILGAGAEHEAQTRELVAA